MYFFCRKRQGSKRKNEQQSTQVMTGSGVQGAENVVYEETSLNRESNVGTSEDALYETIAEDDGYENPTGPGPILSQIGEQERHSYINVIA